MRGTRATTTPEGRCAAATLLEVEHVLFLYESLSAYAHADVHLYRKSAFEMDNGHFLTESLLLVLKNQMKAKCK